MKINIYNYIDFIVNISLFDVMLLNKIKESVSIRMSSSNSCCYHVFLIEFLSVNCFECRCQPLKLSFIVECNARTN